MAQRFSETPFVAQNFGAQAIESDRVVPAFCDRQAIRYLAIVTAELALAARSTPGAFSTLPIWRWQLPWGQ
jgi:hypothetical protein